MKFLRNRRRAIRFDPLQNKHFVAKKKVPKPIAKTGPSKKEVKKQVEKPEKTEKPEKKDVKKDTKDTKKGKK